MNFLQLFEGSDMFYLADPTAITFKKNGGVRWGVKKEFRIPLAKAIDGHLFGGTKKGVVLPPIRKSDNKCRWGAIDVDGIIYKDDYFKQELIELISRLGLPLVPCFSKSKGIHLFIRFEEWTDAQKAIDILHSFLPQLNLPPDTECFPKQATVTGTGNGIMLPYMHGIGNDWIKSYNDNGFTTGTREEFEEHIYFKRVKAEDIKIEAPPKTNGSTESNGSTKASTEYSRFEIIKKIKDGTIESCPGMGGKYHGWIQVVIAKGIVDNCDDKKILELIKEVHQDDRGIGYTWPESYQKMITYARNKPSIEEHRKEREEANILEGLVDEETEEKLSKIREGYYYFEDTEEMYDPIKDLTYKEKGFNNKWLFEFPGYRGKKKDDKAFAKLLKDPEFQERKLAGRVMLPGMSYPVAEIKPGDHPLLQGGKYYNLYQGRPLEPEEGDVSKVINHFKKIYGEQNWEHLEQYLAFCIRYPGVKTRWIPLIVSVEGVGKGLMMRMMSKLIGTKYVNENVSFNDITEKHSVIAVGTLFICLNEVVLDKQYSTKRTISSKIKPFITDDFLNINDKGIRPYKYLNNCNAVIFSNDKDCIHVDTSSRRYLVIHCKTTAKEVEKMAESGAFEPLWKMLDEHPEYLLDHFLNQVEIKDEKVYQKRAPKTPELLELIDDSKHDIIQELDGALAEGAPPFDGDNFRGFISLEVLMNFMRHKWNTPYPPRKLVKEWLKENSTEWKPGEKTRQIVMKSGQRPRVYLLAKGAKAELLKCLTEGQLGQMMSLLTDGHYWENLKLEYFMTENVTKDKQGEFYSWKNPKLNQMKYVWFGKEDQTRQALYYLKFMDSDVVNLIIKVKQKLMNEENKLKQKFTENIFSKEHGKHYDALDYVKFNAAYKPIEAKAHKLIDKIIKEEEAAEKADKEEPY